MKFRRCTSFIFLLSLTIYCRAREEWATIFVHGIMHLKPHLSVSNIVKFAYDDIADSIYVRAVEYLRRDPYFWQHHAMQGLGLQPILLEQPLPGNAAAATAHCYDHLLKYAASTHVPTHYFTFGWSGLFSPFMRELEATILYREIELLIQRYRARGIDLKIRLIGYSHGGYIILNIGLAYSHRFKPSVQIDELVLLGVPLSPHAYQQICSPAFKKIYHIFSPGDAVQIVDCLSHAGSLTQRRFEASYGLPEGLQQIEFRCTRLARTTSTGTLTPPITLYRKKLERRADPGHSELYSFAWTCNYRSYWPLAPLPAVAYVGYIIELIKAHCPHDTMITVDFRPFQEKIHIKGESTPMLCLPFLTTTQLRNVAQLAEPYRPADYSVPLFFEKINAALERAAQEKRGEWRSCQTSKKSDICICCARNVK